MQNRNNRARRNAWLDAHNDARLAFQGEDAYNEMEWSNDLFDDAKDHAEELVVNCTTKAPTGDLNDYGWNIGAFLPWLLSLHVVSMYRMSNLRLMPWWLHHQHVAGAQNTPDFRSVDEVFNLWENKLINGWPNNKEYSQVLWRSTEYVGCADAAADEDDMKCTFSVCFYARAGNCGMGQIENWADHAVRALKIKIVCYVIQRWDWLDVFFNYLFLVEQNHEWQFMRTMPYWPPRLPRVPCP